MATVPICSDFGPPPKIKSVTVHTVAPSNCHEVTGPDAMILVWSWSQNVVPFYWIKRWQLKYGCLIAFLNLSFASLLAWSWRFSIFFYGVQRSWGQGKGRVSGSWKSRSSEACDTTYDDIYLKDSLIKSVKLTVNSLMNFLQNIFLVFSLPGKFHRLLRSMGQCFPRLPFYGLSQNRFAFVQKSCP